jgi:hypothetical protein
VASWSNRLGKASTSFVRDPSKAANLWSEHAALLLQLILLHLYRVLTVAGAPFAGAFSLAVWLGSVVATFASEVKRIIATMIGWQSQKISRNSRLFDLDFIPDLRRWQVTLGALDWLPVPSSTFAISRQCQNLRFQQTRFSRDGAQVSFFSVDSCLSARRS